jgi:hypothetical protein
MQSTAVDPRIARLVDCLDRRYLHLLASQTPGGFARIIRRELEYLIVVGIVAAREIRESPDLDKLVDPLHEEIDKTVERWLLGLEEDGTPFTPPRQGRGPITLHHPGHTPDARVVWVINPDKKGGIIIL